MAGVKFTDLPAAAEVTTSDLVCIVDVSDTSESAEGTSKQATVEQIADTIGAITSITSTDGSVTIDNTDPSAPDLSTGFVRSVFQFTIEQNSAVLAQQINKLGGTFSLTNDAPFVFRLTRTGGDPLTGQLIGMFVPGLLEASSALPIVYVVGTYIEIDASITFVYPDGSTIPSDASISATLILDYYPNGWDA